jgi:DUF1365 family protein
MKGHLLYGHVWHKRNIGTANAFRYKVLYAAFELAGLEGEGAWPRLLGVNRFNLYSLNDRDHYSDEQGGFATAIPRLMAREAPGIHLHRVRMITQPSMLGYVFNPVSFYLGEERDGRTALVVAEVHNRHGQRHVYVLHPHRSGEGLAAEFGKDFYVSPFLDMTGEYRFSMKEERGDLELGLDLIQEGERVLETRLDLTMKPLSDSELAKAIISHTLTPQKTLAAIYWQTLKLKAKGARYNGAPKRHEKRSHV